MHITPLNFSCRFINEHKELDCERNTKSVDVFLSFI